MISIIIPTKDRQHQLKECVESILKNRYSTFEIIIIDQTQKPLKKIQKDNHIHYIHKPGKGRSKAINHGLRKAKGNILAFTDDDCVVASNWLEEIHSFFINNQTCGAVTGQTFPFEPNNHKGLFCPCQNSIKEASFLTKPIHHAEIGFGNNIAIKKSVLNSLGNFKEWLGIGSVGLSAEDADIIIRLLLKNQKIGRSPEIKIFHNRWLNQTEKEKVERNYLGGEIACYGYYAFKGHTFAKNIIKRNFVNHIIKQPQITVKSIFRFRNIKKITTQYIKNLAIIVRSSCLVTFIIFKEYMRRKTLNFQ